MAPIGLRHRFASFIRASPALPTHTSPQDPEVPHLQLEGPEHIQLQQPKEHHTNRSSTSAESYSEIVVDNTFTALRQAAYEGSTFPDDEEEGDDAAPSSRRGGASRSRGSRTSGSQGTSAGFPRRQSLGMTAAQQIKGLAYFIIRKVNKFLFLRFNDPEKERNFQAESWETQKNITMTTCMFYVLFWGLSVGLTPKPFDVFMWWTYVFWTGVTILPLPVMCWFNWPQSHKVIWQFWAVVGTWSWALAMLSDMYHCGFYTDHRNCGQRDFAGLFFFASAVPTLAIWSLKISRLPHIVAWTTFIVLLGVFIVSGRPSWSRHVVFLFTFFWFLMYISYAREKMSRQSFVLKERLKEQISATREAQACERQEADSKKRFVSYIFHEVRVPLNIATLAVQTLEGDGVLDRERIGEGTKEIADALKSSLGMMAQVLNDVLDFNRMEEGKLLQSTKPFSFHSVIRTILVGIRVSAADRQITLLSDCDPAIDALGVELMGDEMRLRQVIGNLAGNAVKFTGVGGEVKVVTRLLYAGPIVPEEEEAVSPMDVEDKIKELGGKMVPAVVPCPTAHTPATRGLLLQPKLERFHSTDSAAGDEPLRTHNHAIIRVEIVDSGVGIKKSDMKDNQLFSPYVQTEEGRRQGGKGTGLGLALVRNIVELSGGRLGVRSVRGKGSTFWVEMAYGLPPDWVPTQHHIGKGDGHRRPRAAAGWASEATMQNLAVTLEPKNSPRDCGNNNGTVKSDNDISMDDMFNNKGAAVMHVDEVELTPCADREVGPGVIKLNVEISDEEGESSVRARRPGLMARPSVMTQQSSSDTSPLLKNDEGAALASTTILEKPTLPPPTGSSPARNCNPGLKRESGDEARPMTAPAPLMSSKSYDPSAPTILQEHPHLHERSESEPVLTTRTLQILVVDDDMITRRLMTRLISRMGHSVTAAEDGSIAIKALQERRDTETAIDLVFLDNQMPILSGVEAVRQMRRLGYVIPVCGVTGNALKEDQEEFLWAGADRVLTKPVMEADVKDVIRFAMEKKQRLLEESAGAA
ncbi:hypothetical protein YB2330_003187 [Saitoella coloradoensis]